MVKNFDIIYLHLKNSFSKAYEITCMKHFLFTGPTRPNSMEGRASRQREKIQRKYLQRLEEGHYQNQNRPPPRSRVNKQKGTFKYLL